MKMMVTEGGDIMRGVGEEEVEPGKRKIQTPEKIAVIILKIEQCGFTIE